MSADPQVPEPETRTVEGVMIATVVGFVGDRVLVQLPDREEATLVRHSCGIRLRGEDIGGEVVLCFVNGDPQRPLLLDRVLRPTQSFRATIHERELVFEGDQQITLRCGKSSLTLRRDGKIVLRGEELLSLASSVNRIRGGRIELN